MSSTSRVSILLRRCTSRIVVFFSRLPTEKKLGLFSHLTTRHQKKIYFASAWETFFFWLTCNVEPQFPTKPVLFRGSWSFSSCSLHFHTLPLPTPTEDCCIYLWFFTMDTTDWESFNISVSWILKHSIVDLFFFTAEKVIPKLLQQGRFQFAVELLQGWCFFQKKFFFHFYPSCHFFFLPKALIHCEKERQGFICNLA